MASLRQEKSGKYSVLVVVHKAPGEHGRQKRKTIRLIATSKSQAEESRIRIQELADRVRDGEPRSKAASNWLSAQSNAVRDRLERAGLVEMRRQPELEAEQAAEQAKEKTLEALTQRFLDSKAGVAPNTRETYDQAIANLLIEYRKRSLGGGDRIALYQNT